MMTASLNKPKSKENHSFAFHTMNETRQWQFHLSDGRKCLRIEMQVHLILLSILKC